MQAFQCFLFCSCLCSVSVEAFGTCESATDNAACPDNSACVNLGGESFECQCEDGFDMIDLPDITIEGGVATVCIDLGYCSPFDNNEIDCQNGQCAIYKDQYGSFQTICRCKSGYYGEKCDSTTQQSRSDIVRGEVVIIALLAGVAAVLSSLM